MEASSRLLAVSSAATMNPSASTPMCSFRQSRRFFDALCLSAKHLHRYVDEFVGRHNMRSLDTLDQMAAMAKRMHGTRLSYKELVA